MDKEDVGRVIDHAIRERLSLRIAYQALPNELPSELNAIAEGVHVYFVCPQAWVKPSEDSCDVWYFVAWCDFYRDHRAFHLGRTRVLDVASSQIHEPSMWIDHPPTGFMFAASPCSRPDELDWKDVAADAMREGRTALAIDTLAREDNVRFWTLIGEIRAGRHGEACQPKDFEPFTDAFMIGILRAALQDAIAIITAWSGWSGDTKAPIAIRDQIKRWRELLTSMTP